MTAKGQAPTENEAADHAAVVAFLADPRSHTSHPSSVERHETHGAIVFLAGDNAYKIKKPVRFTYMDFSTRELRRRACEHEYDINRPHAPEIYLGVVPITRGADGQLAIGGTGDVLEWSVHMRRFDQDQMLDSVSRRLPLPPALCFDLADTAFALHRSAKVVPGHDATGQLRKIGEDVVSALRMALPGYSAQINRFARDVTLHLERVAPLLDRRSQHGCVRICHGDMHLGNVVVLNGKPIPFDAIEFDDRIATVDTLYDLVFLLMDLIHCDQTPAANAVLNRYLWRANNIIDLAGLAALPLFMALRAGVRAMVLAQRAAQPDAAEANRRGAVAYLAQAIDHLSPQPPLLVAIGGLSGTGKSTLGARLAPSLGASPGAVHLRSDLERKALFGAGETERLPADAYTAAVSAKVYAIMIEKAAATLAAGHAVIADAVFLKRFERDSLEAVAAAAGVPCVCLWLEAGKDMLMSRVASRRGDASDATPAVVELQLAHDTGDISWNRIHAGTSPDATFAAAIKHLDRILSAATSSELPFDITKK